MREEGFLHLNSGAFGLRPLQKEDASLLLRWLCDPRVLEYWEGKSFVFTPQIIQAHFFEPEENLRRCVLEYESLPVGYLQVCCLDREKLEEYQYAPPAGALTFGLDLFLGEPRYWGKRLGRAFLSLVLSYLCGKENAYAVVVDPHADNLRAISCYEACGFQKRKLLPAHELHDGQWKDCWLMEYRKNSRVEKA